jgi:hypothetical protein
MADSFGPVLADLSYLAAGAVFIYGAYWAFAIRRALVGRIYRTQALWLGALFIAALIASDAVLLPLSDNWFVTAVVRFLAYGPWPILVVFAFLDSTIPVLRRSDPLLRRIFHWKKLRIVIWCILAFTTLFAGYASIYLPACFSTGNTPACISSAMNNSGWLGAVLGFWGSLYWVDASLVLILGAAALLSGARRSSDTVLRKSLSWLGLGLLCVPCLVLVSVLEGIIGMSYYGMIYSYGIVPWNAVAILLGYALYRSARSLAPLSRLPSVEPEITQASQAVGITGPGN